jgi:hypothetical protein
LTSPLLNEFNAVQLAPNVLISMIEHDDLESTARGADLISK